MLSHIEHEAVTGTVHGFDTELTLIAHVDEEHILLIGIVVPTRLPEVDIVEVRCNDFIEASQPVLLTKEVN